MQLMLIFGIAFAIGAVAFALQNNVAVTVTLAVWQFDGSLALVLLVALGLGVLIACLLTSPTVIRGQWTAARLRYQVTDLEKKISVLEAHNNELISEMARNARAAEAMKPQSADEKPYVGLRTLLSGEEDVKS